MAIHQELNSCCDIYKYDEDGALLLQGDLDGAAQPIGIAVDNQERVYYRGYYQWIERWQYSGGGGSSNVISTWEYTSPPKTGIAVDPASGTLYVGWGGTEIARFSFNGSGEVILPSGAPCNYECDPTAIFGAGEVSNTKGMFVDPTHHELYVDQGNRILRFRANGRRAAGPDIGAKVLSNSIIRRGRCERQPLREPRRLRRAQGGGFRPAGPGARSPHRQPDDHQLRQRLRHPSHRRLPGHPRRRGRRLRRRPLRSPDTRTPGTRRSSATTRPTTRSTASPATRRTPRRPANRQLARNGLSLTDDGRVIFNSTDPLVPSDLDNREDVYEWSPAGTSLISTGLSPFNSSLLSASADGKDAFFFTRDTLVPQDRTEAWSRSTTPVKTAASPTRRRR